MSTAQARLLAERLTRQGFEVLHGSLELYTEADCPASYQEMGLCYANNPAAPYVLVSLPAWSDEFIDPATDTAFGYNKRAPYRLDPREAIVILGRLPPPAKYFGLQSYLFTRQGEFDTTSKPYQDLAALNKPELLSRFFTYVPQDHQRIIQFASLGNAINNVVIAEQSGAAFDEKKAFIITPDRLMDAAVRQALKALPVASQDIFTEPIPPGLNLGLEQAADDFVSVIRYAMPDDGGDPGTRSDAWRSKLPLAVLRIRDTRPGRQPVPFDPVVLEPRVSPTSIPCRASLNSLAAAVAARWGQPAALNNAQKFMVVQKAPFNLVGPECLKIGENCLADTQDTCYQYTLPLPMTDNIVYAALGALGTQTGNATYVGLGLTSSKRLLGFDNLSDPQLLGTANFYSSQVAQHRPALPLLLRPRLRRADRSHRRQLPGDRRGGRAHLQRPRPDDLRPAQHLACAITSSRTPAADRTKTASCPPWSSRCGCREVKAYETVEMDSPELERQAVLATRVRSETGLMAMRIQR